MPYRSQVLVV